jgi:hypothetical protein
MVSAKLRLQFVPMPDWPVLAWVARCEVGNPVVTVFHGPRVETTSDWFHEAVWAGEYDEGSFDETDVVAGSGGRVRQGRVIFVSSGATVDRLHSVQARGSAWVSNSLASLLAATGGTVDATSSRYFWIFRTIVGGLQKASRNPLPTTVGNVALTYFNNLSWDGHTLAVVPKPGASHDFSSFDRYASFMRESMSALGANAAARERTFRYELLSTASSGYDSSTVTVLAREAGAKRVLCIDQAGRGIDDSGEPLARCLGMEPVVVAREAWTQAELPETTFIAADAHGGDVFFKGAEHVLRGKVLLTGYHGDKVWAKSAPHVDDNIYRGDQSGLSLTEYRLTVGAIHCPASFWGVRQIADLHRISNSPEMAPWDVPGDYSRPICRRIVEGAGVPRELFGQKKRATWVFLQHKPKFLSPTSMQDYLQWLERHRWQWMRRGRVPPVLSTTFDDVEVKIRKSLGRMARGDRNALSARVLHTSGGARVFSRLSEGPSLLRRYAFPWALAHHMRSISGPV